jgi:Lrp/AsnC family leucine-responsive transcriptional regulator
MQSELDKIDVKILFHLQRNAKIPIKEIAERVHLPLKITRARIKCLEKEGYIQNYVAVLNKNKINKKLVSFTGLQLNTHAHHNLLASITLINEFPEVINCYVVNGDFDFLLYTAVADMQEYNSFYSNTLLKIENVKVVRTFFVLQESKAYNSIDLTKLCI